MINYCYLSAAPVVCHPLILELILRKLSLLYSTLLRPGMIPIMIQCVCGSIFEETDSGFDSSPPITSDPSGS